MTVNRAPTTRTSNAVVAAANQRLRRSKNASMAPAYQRRIGVHSGRRGQHLQPVVGAALAPPMVSMPVGQTGQTPSGVQRFGQGTSHGGSQRPGQPVWHVSSQVGSHGVPQTP